MTPLPWFRVYANDLLTDRKIKRICKRTGQSKALIIGIWIILLCLANDSPNRGHLNIAADMPYTVDDLEDETGLPPEVLAQLLDEFRSHGMINGKATIQISNWDKRQYKSDSSAERVRTYREKRNVTVTPEKRYSNVLDTDTEESNVTRNVTETEQKRYTSPDAPSSFVLSAERIFTDVTGMATFPGNQRHYIDIVDAMRDTYGVERTTEAMKNQYSMWCSTKRKDGSRNYSGLNLTWIDRAQEELAPSPVSVRVKETKDMTSAEFHEYLLGKDAHNDS